MENSANIGYLLPMALGIAISPVPIMLVIMMLFSQRATSNGIAFLSGWITGLVIVGILVVVLSNAGLAYSEAMVFDSANGIKLLLGIFFLLMAYISWRSRPKGDEAPVLPDWMARIDAVSPWQSTALGAMNTGLNPKNLSLTLAAALTLVQAGISGMAMWLVLLIFVVIASLPVAIPIFYYLFAGDDAESTLDSWKSWLATNNSIIVAILFLFLGVQLIGDGLGGFLLK